MKTYLWIEDRKEKSGYIFWKTFMGQLCPEIVVESKKNNSELIKAVKTIKDDGNKYVILFDNLDTGRLQLKEKMQHICRKTSLLAQFQQIGLEVAL